MKKVIGIFLILSCGIYLQAQENSDTINTIVDLEEVEVTVSRKTTSYKNAARIVTVITESELNDMSVQSVQDVLDFVSGVDLRQRGPMGIQADVSIRGGSFDQALILLNGINITDPQTGHLSMNLPVDMSSIERVEILEGPGAKVFGPNAFSGAINFITKSSKQNYLSARFTSGEYGFMNSGVSSNYVSGKFTSFISGQYSKSDGYHQNTDFNQSNIFYNGKFVNGKDAVDFQIGYNDKSFGAFSFYTPDPDYSDQYEQNRTLISSLRFSTGKSIKVTPALYWRRNHDRFTLFRYDPDGKKFFHLTDVVGGNVNALTTWKLGTSALGGEVRSESIFSNSMGLQMDKTLPIPREDSVRFDHSYGRVNSSLFFEHTYNISKFTAVFGLLMNMNSGLDYRARFFPGLDLSYWISNRIKVIGSVNKSLRMPTFTDLFYNTPNTKGNRSLSPEEVWGYEMGTQYYHKHHHLAINAFYRSSTNAIDWGRFSDSDYYQSINILDLDTYGGQLNYKYRISDEFSKLYFFQSFEFDYLYQTKDVVEISDYDSRYALDFLKHKMVLKLNHRIFGNLGASWSAIAQDRQGYYEDADKNKISYEDILLVNVKAKWETSNYLLFAEVSNLLDKTYYDIGNVPQPGRWFRAGISVKIDLD